MENKIRVLYDSQIFDYQILGGISRYFCEIIKKIQIPSELSVHYSNNYHLYDLNLNRDKFCKRNILFDSLVSDIRKINLEFTKKRLQSTPSYIFHPTYYDPYFFEYIGKNPYVITVHDMIYEKFPQFFTEASLIIQQKQKVITNANRIIAISENTKKDIVEILGVDPEKIDVIYHGTNIKLAQESSFEKLPKRYLLYVGARYSYKNFERFLRAFSILEKNDQDLSLICTGSLFNFSEKKLIEELDIHDKIFQIQVSDVALGELYANAELFIFPSIYEGFGLPILEAYACHCPIALSYSSCFPEIAGDAAAYFDPYSIDDIANTISSIIYDFTKRTELITRGNERIKLYSWQKTANETVKIYKNMISNIL